MSDSEQPKNRDVDVTGIWYNNIPKPGILCWVKDFESSPWGINPAVIIAYYPHQQLERFVTTTGEYWQFATPIKSSEFYFAENATHKLTFAKEIAEAFDDLKPFINTDFELIISQQPTKDRNVLGLLYLGELLKGTSNQVIHGAGHDVIYLCDLDKLVGKVTRYDIQYLKSCRVHVEDDYLQMYV